LGITVLRKRDVEQKLWPLPVDKMYGVGKKTAEKLHKIKIRTIGELANTDEYTLTQLLGINGQRLRQRANGLDTRAVDPDSVNEFKSIGNSQTLPNDTTDEKEIRSILLHLSERVADRLERRALTGKNVQLMIRYSDRQTITRSKKLATYVGGLEDIVHVIYELLNEHWNLEHIRLLGVTVSDLIEKKDVLEQLSLFTYEQVVKKSKRDETLNELKKKYGKNAFPNLSFEDEQEEKKKE